MRFARSLAKLRKEKKVSQRTAAAALGVSQALLSHYENGLREPGLEFLVNAGKYYDCSIDRLLGLEHAATADEPVSAATAAKALTEFASGSDEMLGELAEEYLMRAAHRLLLLLKGDSAGALIASDAALKADELALLAALPANGLGDQPELLTRLAAKVSDMAEQKR